MLGHEEHTQKVQICDGELASETLYHIKKDYMANLVALQGKFLNIKAY